MAEGGHTSGSISAIQDCKETCSICLELIREPRFLPCEHRFCALCLIGYIDKCFTSGNSDVIPCPLCRAEIHVSNYTKAKSSEVDDISKLDLLSFSHVTSENESRRIKDNRCQPCKRGNENVKATHFCSECSECICSVCVTHHSRSKWTCNHTVTTINVEVKPKQDDMGCDFPTRCELHGKKQFKYICMNDNILCCSKCVIEGGHRTCSNVKSLTEFRKSNEYDAMVERVEELRSTVSKNCEKMKQEQLKCISNVADKTYCLMKTTKELEKNILSEVSKIIHRQREPILEKLKSFKEKSSKAVQTFEEIKLRTYQTSLCLNEVENNNGKVAEIVVICETEKRLKSDKTLLSEIAVTLENNTPNIDMEIDPVSEHFMEKLRGECRRLSSGKCILFSREGRPTLTMQVSKTEKINDMTFLQNGNVVIADNTNSLTVLNSYLNRIKSISLPSQPTSITEYNQNTVVVALPATKQLAIVTFKKKSCDVSTVEMKKVITCVASSTLEQNRIILAYDPHTRSLWKQVVTSSISKSFHEFAENLAYVQNICVDGSTQMVYVSQPKLNRIIGLDFEGERKFAFTHQRLHVPFGMHLSQTDKLYICCYGTQQINELTLSKRELKDVLCRCDGIVGPVSLTFDKSLTRCLVYDIDKGRELKLFDV